jgi:hypothetical protein
MKTYYRYDEDFYFVGMELEDGGEFTTDIRPPDGLYKARFVDGEWVETGEPPTITDADLTPTFEERLKACEEAIMYIAEELHG